MEGIPTGIKQLHFTTILYQRYPESAPSSLY